MVRDAIIDKTFKGFDHYMDDPNFTWDDLRYILTLKYGPAFSGGLDRMVFMTPFGVCKLPYPNSECVNYKEESAYQIGRDNEGAIPVARCRIVCIKGFPLLFMEWVVDYYKMNLRHTDLPFWCGFVDGLQVGFNRAGKLVAYDAAY